MQSLPPLTTSDVTPVNNGRLKFPLEIIEIADASCRIVDFDKQDQFIIRGNSLCRLTPHQLATRIVELLNKYGA